MTENQATQIIKNPNTKKAMAVLVKYAELESKLKNAKEEADEASEQIKQAMIESGVPKIEINLPELNLTGYITLAERTTYRTDDINAVADDLLKPALDTEKVKAAHVLTGELPAGISETKTQYITKKFKVTE